MNETLALSIVIPVYNEEKRLAKTFAALTNYLADPIVQIREIIFVDDGSRDSTREMIVSFQKKCPVKVSLLSYSPNRGKGYAVKTGMKAIGGGMTYILMCDADMSTPLCEIAKFVPAMERGVPVIIGSRKAPGSHILEHQNWIRQKMGESYASLACFITGLNFKDLGCGFKVFSKQSAEKIFPEVRTNGWIFDTEALLLARKNNFAIEEVGVDWVNDKDSRVKIFSGIVDSLINLLLIRLHHL